MQDWTNRRREASKSPRTNWPTSLEGSSWSHGFVPVLMMDRWPGSGTNLGSLAKLRQVEVLRAWVGLSQTRSIQW